jgi:hypothetical protein
MKNIKTTFEIKKHWQERLGKIQRKNLQNERFGIGSNHSDIRFILTQLAIKFKI